MSASDATLQPLLTHLYGAVLGRLLATAAAAGEGDRVVILNAEPTGPEGWALPGDPVTTLSSDEQVPPDPLPIVDFVHWRGGPAFREAAAGWNALLGVPPFGQIRADEMLSFLEVAHETAAEQARAVLIVPTAAVARHSTVVREALLLSGRVPSITFATARSGSGRQGAGLPPSLHVAVVLWEPGPANTGITVIASAESESSFSVVLGSKSPWSFAALDPDRAQKIQRWASIGRAKRLQDVATLVTVRRVTGHALPVISPRQITPTGLASEGDADREYEEQRDGPVVPLEAGDIVARSMGQPNWTMITEADAQAGLAATRNVLVIRPAQVDPGVLLAFLKSDAALLQLEPEQAGATIPRITPRTLRQLLVPTLDATPGTLPRDEPISSFRSLSASLADDLEARYRAAFDKPQAEQVLAALADAAGDAAMAMDLVGRVTDPLHRARQFFPHPLARTLRVLDNHRRANSHADVYNDTLRFGETAIILLGAVGLSYLAAHDEVDQQWREGVTRGGISLGTWLKGANAGAERARRDGETLGGLAAALATNSPLNKSLSKLLEARNDEAHGAGPRSPYEYEQSSLELEETLHAAVHELAPLARSDWFIVERLAWSGQSKTFSAVGRSLRGDHPDFTRWIEDRPVPLESDVIHVRLGGRDLALQGFCVLRACSRCLHEELYYPDRVRGSMVRLRSLDRGHQAEVPVAESGLPLAAITP